MGGTEKARGSTWPPVAAGALVALAGALALLSWPCDIPALRADLPGVGPVNPDTALVFLWTGLALAFLAPRSTPRWRQVLGLACAALAAGWGGASLIDYVSAGASDGVGVVSSRLASLTHLPFQGTTSVWGALLAVMLGFAPLFLNVRRANWFGELLVLAPLSIGFLGLVAESFRVTGLPGGAGERPSALPTLLGYLLLEIGLLTARPNRGAMAILTGHELGGALARRLLPVAVLVPFGAMWLCLLAQKVGVLRRDHVGAIYALAVVFVQSVLILGYAAIVNRTDRRRKEAEEFVRSLLRVGARLNSTLDVDSLLSILASEAAHLTHAQGGVSGVRAAGGMTARQYVGDGRPLPCDFCWPAGEGLAGWVAEHRRPYHAHDAAADPVVDPQLRERFGVRSALAAPVLDSRGEVLGFVEVHNKPGGFTPRDQDRLLAVAQSAAGALQNALAYHQVREAELALRTLDRQKNEFIALLAHELRNPLAPLRNGLQILDLSSGNAAATARAREMMDRQLGHLVRLIDDLLDVSRIARNKLNLCRGRVLLADVVASAVETAGPAIQAEGHELIVSLPGEPVPLDADLTRLAQVFGNLLLNSAKYTRPGGRIWLSAERRGGEVVVTVRDTGIGIPANALPRIFDMFSQVDRSIERSAGGLGIGLALVKGLVEMHGGTVGVASEEGQGSTFTVTLPVTADGAKPPAAEIAPAQVVAAGLRILAVDDNRDGAESLAEMLRLLGHEVETAGDGVEAVERAERFRPEVVLMDLGMPRLNGYDATRRIREQPWGAPVTVIALSGWGHERDRERSREAGCDGHLVKPVSMSDLVSALAECRGRRRPSLVPANGNCS